jgi:hypothetical protein
LELVARRGRDCTRRVPSGPDHHHVAAHKRRPPLHPLERWLVGVLIVVLLWLPWAFAGVYSWVQIPAAILAAVALGLALVTRRYKDNLAPGGDFTLVMWPRLVRFPLFWLGLGLLVLLVVQAFNPAWVRHEEGTAWWLTPKEHLTWLPQSAPGPFLWMNVWREFVIYAGVWLAVCAVWVGITRRYSLQLLVMTLVVNGLVVAGVGIAQRATQPGSEGWMWSDRVFEGAMPFAGFVYYNHAGAYLVLLTGAALGLAVWTWFNARLRMARSSPASLWGFAAFLLSVGTAATTSRGATLTLAVLLVAATAAFFVVRRFAPIRSTMPPMVGVALALVLLGAAAFVWRYVDLSTVQARFMRLSRDDYTDVNVLSRDQVREVSLAMYADYWLLGSGAGSYRWVFVRYLEKRPEFVEAQQKFWEYTHCDWLEIPIELGLPGVLLIGGAFGWLMVVFVRHRGWRHPVALFVLLGCGQTLAHAYFDFPFQAPSILMTWWILLVAAIRWMELEAAGAERPNAERSTPNAQR